jgi:RNA polymerase sigma factor (sigma-70 family)
MLLDFEKIESSSATDRNGAVTMLGEAFYSVVITDLCLHTMEEGLQLIDDVRRLSPRSKVVVLSGFVDEATEHDLLGLGVTSVIHKPAESAALIASVRELLELIELEAGPEEPVDLERLYLTVRKKLYDIPRRRFGLSHERAEDVLQEAWVLFLQKRSLIRSAGPWLAGAVANLSRQQIDQRVRKRETSDEDELMNLNDESNSGELSNVLAMRQALARIDDRGRLLCALIGIQGLSYEEVSAATGVPLGSIGPLYIRAKKKLRDVLSH